MPTVLDICSGAGGELLGLEMAGFTSVGAIENDTLACQTLRHNRPELHVIEADIHQVSAVDFRGVDLLAGGVPCPPFSIAGKQLGAEDERDLFPAALRCIAEARPSAVLLENVPGFATAKFAAYRQHLLMRLTRLGYDVQWQLLNASDFGVPQLRPRCIVIAIKPRYSKRFHWPAPSRSSLTVGESIGDLIQSQGWLGAAAWRSQAQRIAPTLVGGSKKHGGPDLGPTRAREQWALLRVDGKGIADHAPAADFPANGLPRLTLRMAARIQAFPDSWEFMGGKTGAYRQIGNALPPPVARAVGEALLHALHGRVTRPRYSVAPQMMLLPKE